jgi:phosphate transport system protein
MAPVSRARLDSELRIVRDSIIQMTSLVDDAIVRGFDALITRDMELARRVVAEDGRINAKRYDVEQECLKLLATQYPQATDLRLTLAAMHIAIELERIGDHAAGIANLVLRMETDPDLEIFARLPKMVKRARDMVSEAVNAFLEQNVALAEKQIKRDDKLDNQYVKLFRETLETMRTEDGFIRRGTFILWVGHNLERIGDRATNIAERVIFVATGRYPETELTFSLDEDSDDTTE